MIGLAVVVLTAACSIQGSPEDSSPASTTAAMGQEDSAAAVADVAVAYPVVDTGQVSFYDNEDEITEPAEGAAFLGQDAAYDGSLASYTDNGDGTVTDNVTGLMWQQDPGDKMTYTEAAAAADSFELGGYDDWRLPSIKELYSLIDFSGLDPSCFTSIDCEMTPFIDTGFFAFEYGDTDAGERVIDSQWATSTLYVGTTMGGDDTMFGVNFADGRIKGYPIIDPQGGEKEFFVMYVRGNPDYGVNDFVDNGDGSVSDRATGLIWQQSDSTYGMDWSEALNYCTALDTGGYDDWRLPNAKELQSILDYTRSPGTTDSAAIDPIFSASVITDEGGDTNYASYWTGTTHARAIGGTDAVYIVFGEALGWMKNPQTGEYTLLDVHGAGAQRSDPKTGTADDYPYGRGPQGDIVRIDNYVRCTTG
jgi:hypothetical protein